MLEHDFQEMPGKSMAVGDNPHETVMILKCKFCLKTPSKARQDGCPMHELEEKGWIALSDFNPGGVEYFKGRKCVTCGDEIMTHWLKRGSDVYWCDGVMECGGITDCTFETNGIEAPQDNVSKTTH